MGELSIIRRGGGGGAALNYKVVGGTVQPIGARENTLWVNTSTAITSHAFSATEPESPVEGIVWFSVGTSCSAPINVLKKDNVLMVYPVSCKQYIDGVWVGKTAKTYQDGAWKEWVLYLYKGAEDVSDISGGWEKYSGSGTLSISDGVLSFKMPGKQYGTNSGVMRHKTAVNMSSFKTVVISCYAHGYTARVATFHIYDASGNSAASVDIGTVTGQVLEKTIDITDLQGEFFFGLALSSYWDGSAARDTQVDVYEVKLTV